MAGISFDEVFEAYQTCRKNKKQSDSAIAFEIDFERLLVNLYDQINAGTYVPGPVYGFVVTKPVHREIFAAEFCDRIVHHLIINKTNHLFEKIFIYDSCSCRVGKGTLFGIQRLEKFVRQCTMNYAKDAYYLKLDIQGYFMSINRNILYDKLETFLKEAYHEPDKELIIKLCRSVVFHQIVDNCSLRGNLRLWEDLPRHKSLFYAPEGCGIPIGNLTSQIFSNFYLNDFDHYIKHTLGVRYYTRYVDDFVLVHNSREFLEEKFIQIEEYLRKNLKLTLHPGKIELDHVNAGIKYLGAVVHPYHIKAAERIKKNFSQKIHYYNNLAEQRRPTEEEILAFQSSINSYLGIIRHYSTYRLRRKLLDKLSPWWLKRFTITEHAYSLKRIK